MAVLFGDGAMARSISPLLAGLLAISVIVIVVISALALTGALRRRSRVGLANTAVTAGPPATAWIGIGVGVSTLALIGLIVWSTMTLAFIAHPPDQPAFSVAITAHQWWWGATYENDDVSQMFTVANEIHIPVGKSVRFTLASPDVIHSFWIPALGGKTDVVPGQTNVTWLEADRPGVYRGQCSEYCGEQHAHMAFAIVADSPAQFATWRAAQLASAAEPVDNLAARDGEGAFLRHCAVCHTVRGSPAGGRVGPDLTHLMSRATLAAGEIPNNPGWLSAWIADPQHLKPGSLMPNLPLSGSDLASVRAYLLTLN
jgi:cytochrome c oxidase subunit 2